LERDAAAARERSCVSEPERILVEAAKALLGCEPGERLYELIVEGIGRIVPSDGLVLYGLSGRRTIRPLLVGGCWAEQPAKLGWGEGLPGRALAEGRLLVGEHAGGAGATLALPLLGREAPIGVLVLRRDGPEACFSADQCERGFAFAGLAGLALGQASQMESLVERGRRDGLTGLYNYQHGQRMLGELCRHGEPFSLIVFDVDELKQVNDGYGHRWGDEVLRAFGGALAHATRTGDLAFRTGGDEFMLLLPTAGRAAAEKFVRRIEQECRHVPLLTLLQIGFSHGLAHAPDNASTQTDLLEHADRNLYQNKHTRKLNADKEAM
jgi:diguanylate cyclase (GGDEF)-like protein